MDKIVQTNSLKRNVSQVYLSLVPLLGIIFGFGVGYISYKIYLPIWTVSARATSLPLKHRRRPGYCLGRV